MLEQIKRDLQQAFHCKEFGDDQVVLCGSERKGMVVFPRTGAVTWEEKDHVFTQYGISEDGEKFNFFWSTYDLTRHEAIQLLRKKV